jgi:hypothetical protein
VRHQVFLGAHRLHELTADQPAQRRRLETERGEPQLRAQLGGAGQHQVSHQDRQVVAPQGIGGRHAVADGGLVHHVVVVQGAGVDEFGDHRGVDHLGTVRLAELRAEQRQPRAEPLAARLQQVGRVLLGEYLVETGLHFCQSIPRDGGHEVSVLGAGRRADPS